MPYAETAKTASKHQVKNRRENLKNKAAGAQLMITRIQKTVSETADTRRSWLKKAEFTKSK